MTTQTAYPTLNEIEATRVELCTLTKSRADIYAAAHYSRSVTRQEQETLRGVLPQMDARIAVLKATQFSQLMMLSDADVAQLAVQRFMTPGIAVKRVTRTAEGTLKVALTGVAGKGPKTAYINHCTETGVAFCYGSATLWL
jgi:hypothetical protein